MRIPTTQTLYIRSMGKALKVTAIFTTTTAANEYMERHRNEGVVSEFNGMILLANVFDKGEQIGA